MKTSYFVSALHFIPLILALGVPCGAWAQNGTVLVRLAEGQVITTDEYTDFIDRRLDLRGIARNEWGQKKALTELIETRVLVLEGERINEPRVGDAPHSRIDEKYAFAVYKKIVPPCEKPADQTAAKQYFDAHPEAFRLPVQAKVSRVMLPVADKVDGIPAMEWLLMQAQAIAGGAVSIRSVAERAGTVHSQDVQGDLGWIMLPEETPLMRALAEAQPSELVGPVREGDFGYMFLIDAKRDARQLSWSEVSQQAAVRAVEYCRQTVQAKFREDLLKRYKVEIDQKVLLDWSNAGRAR